MKDPSLRPEHFLRDRVVRLESLITSGEGGLETRPHREGATAAGDRAMTGTEPGPAIKFSSCEGGSARFSTSSPLLVLSLRPSHSDLSGFNQLSARLLNRTASPLLVGMKIVHGSETFGSGIQDVSLSGGREELRPAGWRDLKFPVESFGTYGSPRGWRDIREIELTFTREKDFGGSEPIDIEIESLDGEFREIPPGPRLTPQGLKEVLSSRVRYNAELPTKNQTLDDWIREVWSPGPPFVTGDSGLLIPPPHQYPREAADEILSGRIMGQTVGYPFAWDISPSGVLEWSHFLHRHHFMRELILALVREKDERYGQELDGLISSWISFNPVPVGSNGGAGPSWETLSAAWRLREWLWLAGIVWPDGSFRESTKTDILRSIWEHARSLMDHRGHPNNWIIVESSALALAGICFPGFWEAGLWLKTGLERLESEFHRQFYADGVHFEISPLYHSICLQAALEVKQAGEARGVPLPEIFDAPLERCADYLVALCRPDFTWPSLNDSGSTSSDYTALMRKAGEVFQRSDLVWIGSRGAQGTPPNRGFSSFSDAGIATFRSHYGPDANFLVFRAGPPGASHVHGDALSIDVAAIGVPRLVDPGITTYAPDRITEYYRSPYAHNVLLIDGQGPDRSSLTFREKIRQPGSDFSCRSEAFVDVATGVCRGPWRGVGDECAHTRTVVFLKPDYWIVRDLVEGVGEHEISVCWQFYPSRIELDIETLIARCVDVRGPRFELLPLLGSNRADVEISTGLLNPPRGWVSLNGSDMPATNCAYRVNAILPAALVWLLLPVSKGPVSGVQATRRDLDEGAMTLEICFPAGRGDLIRLDKERVEVKSLLPNRFQ